jgi:hypothetical protein
MTCTNNSTISGILVSQADANNGKRLSFKQDTSKNWSSSIASGDVIRFDVDATRFVSSVADPNFFGSFDLSNAEVVGVVESFSYESGTTYATVVTHGLMNYPNLLTNISGICGSAGGDGGTDVLFLSPTTPGGITYSIDPGMGYIAKPVLQVCPVSSGDYNSVVINYLGYETAEAQSFTIRKNESGVGDIKIVDSSTTTPDGWINSSEGQYLSVDDYSDAFEIYRTNYGAIEQLSVNGSSSFVSGLINKMVRPVLNTTGKGVGTFGEVISVDTVNNTITVQYNSKGFSLWKSSYSKYELDQPIGTTKTIAITDGSLTHFKTPALQTNINVVAGNENEIVNFNTKTLLRVKGDTVVSYLPDSAIFNSIQVSGTLKTQNVTDVDSTLLDLQSRIATLEQILGI